DDRHGSAGAGGASGGLGAMSGPPCIRVTAVDGDRVLRDRIRADLPADAFALHPWRLLLGIPLTAAIAGGSVAVVTAPLPWYVAGAVSIAIGTLYASLFFFGHEVGHGAVIRSRRGRTAVLYVSCLI